MKLREIIFLLTTASVSLSYGHAARISTLLEGSSRVILQNTRLRFDPSYEHLAQYSSGVKFFKNYHRFFEIRNNYKEMSVVASYGIRMVQEEGIWCFASDIAGREWAVVGRNIRELFPRLIFDKNDEVIFDQAFQSLTAYPFIFEDEAIPLINSFFSILRNAPKKSNLEVLLTPFIVISQTPYGLLTSFLVISRAPYDAQFIVDVKLWTEDKVQNAIEHLEQVLSMQEEENLLSGH